MNIKLKLHNFICLFKWSFMFKLRIVSCVFPTRGTQATRLVRCFSSHPEEMSLAPCEPFVLAAGTVHELSVTVRPLTKGTKFFFLNVVDVEYHQLVRSWLVCTTCRSPIVSRAFALVLPVGGGKGCSKRITYTNPYAMRKKFKVRFYF